MINKKNEPIQGTTITDSSRAEILSRAKEIIANRSKYLTIGSNTSQPTLDRLLRPCEVAEALQISVSMVYKLVRKGSLPAIHIMTTLRIRSSDLDNFVRSNYSMKDSV